MRNKLGKVSSREFSFILPPRSSHVKDLPHVTPAKTFDDGIINNMFASILIFCSDDLKHLGCVLGGYPCFTLVVDVLGNGWLDVDLQISLVVLCWVFDATCFGMEMVRSISSFELNWIRFNIIFFGYRWSDTH